MPPFISVCCCHSFFEDYKKNENKMVRVDDILGAAEAIKAVKDGLVSEDCDVLGLQTGWLLQAHAV